MLKRLRAEIDDLDREILSLLERRFAITSAIGQWKKAQGQSTIDPQRETEIISKITALAQSKNLPATQVKNIFKAILRLSYHSQK